MTLTFARFEVLTADKLNLLAGAVSAGAVVFPEAYGAVGDGSTDDSAAFTAALADGATVVGTRGKVYAVKDLVIPQFKTLDMQGGILRAASGAKWVVRLEGWRPQLLNFEIEDTADFRLARRTTLAAGALAAGTSLTLTDATGFEAMQAVAIEQDDGEWHQTLITAVAGSTITLQRGLDGAAASGKRVWATHGAVWLGGDAQWFTVDNGLIKSCWGGIAAKPLTLGVRAARRGFVSRIQAYGCTLFGLHVAGNASDIVWSEIEMRGAANVTDTLAGDGATTVFALSEDVIRVGAFTDLFVYVNNVLQTQGVAYTVTGPREITFTVAPANGATILAINSADGISGLWNDPLGGNILNGGHDFYVRFLDFKYGLRLRDSQLLTFRDGFVDSISRYGVRLEGNVRNCEWQGFQSLFCGIASVFTKADVTDTRNWFNGLKTTTWPFGELESGGPNYAVQMEAGSRLNINGATWHGTRTFDIGAGARLSTPGATTFPFTSAGIVGAGSTVYLGSNGQDTNVNDVEFRAPFTGQLFGLRFLTTAAPGAGQTFTVTVHVANVATAATATISDTGVFSATWFGSVDVIEGQSVAVEVVTSASAVNARFSGVLMFGA